MLRRGLTISDLLSNWMAWPNNGHNKAPDDSGNVPVSAGDDAYEKTLGSNPYMARRYSLILHPFLDTHNIQLFHPGFQHIMAWKLHIARTGVGHQLTRRKNFLLTV